MLHRASAIEAADGSRIHEVTNKTGSLRLTTLKHPEYAPTWTGDNKYSPLEDYEFVDKGLKSDGTFKNLFPKGVDSYTKKLTPKFGSEVRGVQLSQLSDEAKNDLARFVAERGVTVFRDQDFANLSPSEAVKYGEYFGRSHIHPTSGAPEGVPEIHLVYREKGRDDASDYFANHVSSIAWHSDVTYERQPPGTTFLALLEGPESGGDTIFADTVTAYERLSPEFQKRLKGLKVLHSGFEQAQNAKNLGGVVRRQPVQSVHPIVRTHPVTKKNALFVNPQFTRKILGLKDEESELLLNFFYNLLSSSVDLQVRASWEPNTVVVWDNRRAVHTAILDFDTTESTRHAFRLTPQAERPYFEEDKSED